MDSTPDELTNERKKELIQILHELGRQLGLKIPDLLDVIMHKGRKDMSKRRNP